MVIVKSISLIFTVTIFLTKFCFADVISYNSPEVKQLEKLPSEMILKEAAYIYKEPVLTSQKTWMFKKGTLVIIVGVEGDWIEVRDLQKRKGFVKKDVLANKP